MIIRLGVTILKRQSDFFIIIGATLRELIIIFIIIIINISLINLYLNLLMFIIITSIIFF
jgi:hypothetical protein